MVSSKKALDAATTLRKYCKEQKSCQNCIFRKFGADHWDCHIPAFDLRDVNSNYNAKKKNGGYI